MEDNIQQAHQLIPTQTPIANQTVPPNQQLFSRFPKKIFILLTIIAILLLAVGGYILTTKSQKSSSLVVQPIVRQTTIQPSPSPMLDVQQYRSPKLGYQITFPKQDYKYDYSDAGVGTDYGQVIIRDVDIRNTSVEKSQFSISIDPLLDDGTSNFKDFTEKTMLASCDASGLQGEQHCDKVMQVTSYTNPHGLTGYEVFLHLIATGITSLDLVRGPIYVFDIENQASSKAPIHPVRALEVSYTGAPSQPEQELKDKKMLFLLKSIADSLKF